jgi:hypothetical protein
VFLGAVALAVALAVVLGAAAALRFLTDLPGGREEGSPVREKLDSVIWDWKGRKRR